MLLMNHLDKTMMNIGYYYHQRSASGHMTNNLNIVGIKDD